MLCLSIGDSGEKGPKFRLGPNPGWVGLTLPVEIWMRNVQLGLFGSSTGLLVAAPRLQEGLCGYIFLGARRAASLLGKLQRSTILSFLIMRLHSGSVCRRRVDSVLDDREAA